jgi:hypothetical protein
MAMRVRETPSGAVRVSYAILVTFVSGLGGLLVVAMVSPIVTSAKVCAADATLFCGLAMAVLAWVVGAWLLMVWLTHAFRLSWRFMVATVAGQLLVIEMVFQADSLWWLLGAWCTVRWCRVLSATCTSCCQERTKGVVSMNTRMMPLAFQSVIDCFTCGERLEPDVEIAIAYTPSGVELGPVCPRCVESDAPRLRR